MSGATHSDLVAAAVRWLRGKGCRVVLHEPFRSHAREQPDAIGWYDGVSILIEAKASRGDFLADAKKPWRIEPGQGMGDWRIYITPPALLQTQDLPQGWGLIEFDGTKCKAVAGIPTGNASWHSRPFDGHKRNETRLLLSALAQPTATERTRRGICVDAYDQFASEFIATHGGADHG